MVLAIGANGSNPTAIYSTNCSTWTACTFTTTLTGAPNGVAYGNGKWVAVGSGTNTVAYSNDGISWTGIGLSMFSTVGNGVAYGNGKFVAVGQGGNTVAYSTDGVNWTAVSSPLSVGKSVAYSTPLGRWVAVGSGTNDTMIYSTDGTSWTGAGKTALSSTGYSVAFSSVSMDTTLTWITQRSLA